MARFRLVGEGPDDVAVFVALVNRYGLPLAEKGKGTPDKLVIDFPGGDAAVLRKLREVDDQDQWLIDHVRTLLKPLDLTAEDRFGIVVDADHPKAADPDDGFRRRWVQVRDNLRNLGYSDVPDEPDPTGTIVGANQTDRPWVGVWMMPDNRSPANWRTSLGAWSGRATRRSGTTRVRPRQNQLPRGPGLRPGTRSRPTFTHFSHGRMCRVSRWAWPSPSNSSTPTRPRPVTSSPGCAASTDSPAPGSPRRE